jgi:hypothetical protein
VLRLVGLRAFWVVFRHVVVEALGQQGALRAVFIFNRTSHRQLSSAQWYKFIESKGFHTAWTRSGHLCPIRSGDSQAPWSRLSNFITHCQIREIKLVRFARIRPVEPDRSFANNCASMRHGPKNCSQRPTEHRSEEPGGGKSRCAPQNFVSLLDISSVRQ